MGFFAGLGVIGMVQVGVGPPRPSKETKLEPRTQGGRGGPQEAPGGTEEDHRRVRVPQVRHTRVPVPFWNPRLTRRKGRGHGGGASPSGEKAPPREDHDPTVNGQGKALFSKKTVASEEDRAAAEPKPQRLVREWELPSVHLFKAPESAPRRWWTISRVSADPQGDVG
jgi:hypothetical protein